MAKAVKGKKKTKVKSKAAKAKAAAAANGGGKRGRRKVEVSGELKGVSSVGKTYIHLDFSEGFIVLTPTANREENRDTALAALQKALR